METIPRDEFFLRNRYDAFCKAVLRNEAKDYLRELGRQRDREKSFECLTPEELEERGIESLPKNLQEAVEEFEKDPLMKEVLGEEVCGKYSMAKKKEWEDYNATVSQWEIDSYLLRI